MGLVTDLAQINPFFRCSSSTSPLPLIVLKFTIRVVGLAYLACVSPKDNQETAHESPYDDLQDTCDPLGTFLILSVSGLALFFSSGYAQKK